MSTLQTLEQVQARRQQLLQGDPVRSEKQAKDGKLMARARIDMLLDAASFVEMGALLSKDGRTAGVVTGYGTIEGRPVCVFAQDFTVAGGAMDGLVGRKINDLLAMAHKTGAPVIALLDGAGARIEEGAKALAAYAQVFAQMARLSGVVPMLAVTLGPCVGATAMMTQLMDFNFMVRKVGQLMAHGPQVVAATFEKPWTPEQIGGADKAIAQGGAAFAADTEAQAFAQVRKLLGYLPSNNLEDAPYCLSDDLNRELPAFEAGAPVGEILAALADGGDYLETGAGYTGAVTAFATVGGHAVAVAATGGGELCPKAASKLARAIRFADCFGLPVISLIDTKGFKVVSPEEQAALLRAAGQLLYAYAEATTLKVSVVTGQAIGAAYIALGAKANADVGYAWPGAVIAPLSPEAAIQVLNKKEIAAATGDALAVRGALADTYAAQVADGVRAAEDGLIDDVIAPKDTRKLVIAALEMLASKREAGLSKKHGNLPL